MNVSGSSSPCDVKDDQLRLLFSGVPDYGHLLPLIPLARAAIAAGHTIGVLTGTGMADLITTELGAGPAEHLAAGASPDVFSADTAARTGADVFKPTPAIIGEIFGGSRVDLGADESLDVAAGWRPDLIITETFDAVGPMVAAAQGIPWHHAGIGPALPAAIADAIAETAAARYAQRGLTHIRPASYLDPCPPTLQNPTGRPTRPVSWCDPRHTAHQALPAQTCRPPTPSGRVHSLPSARFFPNPDSWTRSMPSPRKPCARSPIRLRSCVLSQGRSSNAYPITIAETVARLAQSN
jgi:hypothetical protein